MPDQINKIICETVNRAINKKSDDFRKDVTYVCTVEEAYENRTYRLKYNDMSYFVTLSNIAPALHEKLRLVIPQGNMKDKYVLEDVIGKYNTGGGTGGSGFSGDYYDLKNYPLSLPANGGNADTVGGYTVKTHVPADAVFTDTIYEHPRTNVASGEYNYVTVDGYGHVTDAKNVLLGDEVVHKDKDRYEAIIDEALNDVII